MLVRVLLKICQNSQNSRQLQWIEKAERTDGSFHFSDENPFEQLWELYQASTGEMLEIEKWVPPRGKFSRRERSK